MKHRKKITWNAGQVPELAKRPRMPAYTPEPDVIDEDLKAAWNESFVGQICTSNYHLASYGSPSSYLSSGFPHPLLITISEHDVAYLNSAIGYIPKECPVIYLGRTYVDCVGTKSRVIKRSYVTIFFAGAKYLVSDPNLLKPI